MAIGSRLLQFTIELADTSRGIYETIELRVAQHASETPKYLCCRLLAALVHWEPGIEFSQGVCVGDEPAVWCRDASGSRALWIEIGLPSTTIIKRALREADRFIIYSHRGVDALQGALAVRELRGVRDRIVAKAFEVSALEALGATIERRNVWHVTMVDGIVWVSVGGESISLAPQDVPA